MSYPRKVEIGCLCPSIHFDPNTSSYFCVQCVEAISCEREHLRTSLLTLCDALEPYRRWVDPGLQIDIERARVALRGM